MRWKKVSTSNEREREREAGTMPRTTPHHHPLFMVSSQCTCVQCHHESPCPFFCWDWEVSFGVLRLAWQSPSGLSRKVKTRDSDGMGWHPVSVIVGLLSVVCLSSYFLPLLSVLAASAPSLFPPSPPPCLRLLVLQYLTSCFFVCLVSSCSCPSSLFFSPDVRLKSKSWVILRTAAAVWDHFRQVCLTRNWRYTTNYSRMQFHTRHSYLSRWEFLQTWTFMLLLLSVTVSFAA